MYVRYIDRFIYLSFDLAIRPSSILFMNIHTLFQILNYIPYAWNEWIVTCFLKGFTYIYKWKRVR